MRANQVCWTGAFFTAVAISYLVVSAPLAAVPHNSRQCQATWMAEFYGSAALTDVASSSAVHTFKYDASDALYVGGYFSQAGEVTGTSRIAKWDGNTWSSLNGGVNDRVYCMASHDSGEGQGPLLYVGGSFTIAGGIEANRIACWDGAEWSPLGSGIGSAFAEVYAIASFDDGSGDGPSLYAGGLFIAAGDIEAHYIAKWDGEAWSALGSGMNDIVLSLAVFDDGSGAGPELYAAGWFTTAGDIEARGVAKWNGSEWRPVAGGINGRAWSLAVIDDYTGDGTSLYIGGLFSMAGGVPASRIAKWNGQEWSGFAGTIDGIVYTIASYHDYSTLGPALFIGGTFTTIDGIHVARIAKWQGESWAPVGDGVTGGEPSSVRTLVEHDDGAGRSLYVGGSFVESPAGDSYLARWKACPVGNGDLNGDGVVDGADLGMLLLSWGDCSPLPTHCDADLNNDGAVDGIDLGILLLNWN